MPLFADWNALKEQQQFNPVGNTREEKRQVGEISNGMVIRYLMNSHTELPN